MDELASDVVVCGKVPQRRLLAASCGERRLSCCAPFDMLVSFACVWSVHACRRLQCRLAAWHCAWCQGMVAASPVSHTVCPSFSCMLSSQPWEARWWIPFVFTVCCTDIGLSGSLSKKANLMSEILARPVLRNNTWWNLTTSSLWQQSSVEFGKEKCTMLSERDLSSEKRRTFREGPKIIWRYWPRMRKCK